MTTDIEIKAGLELDRAVAGLIGLTCTHRVLGSDEEYYVDPRDGTPAIPERFQPSTDLNAAFAAAEAVGLFEKYHLCCGEWEGSRLWEINEFLTDGFVVEDEIVLASGPTAALAICAAILNLKTANQPSGTAAPS